MNEIIVNVLGGVLASVILAAAGLLAARWYAPKRREILRLYEQCARQVLHLSRQQARSVFRDEDVQRQLLNPSVGLEQEWAVLVDEMKQRGVAEEALPSPEPFYQELILHLELSQHWHDRTTTLTEQLKALREKVPLEALPPSASLPQVGPLTPVPARLKRHNLPTPALPFIGREQEIAEWREILLQPTTRLLTLVGFGGMGKTRSALHLADLCADEFADGVYWIELEEVRTREAMMERLVAQMDLPIQPPPPPAREQLLNSLRERHLLLVLDNTEQIADAEVAVSALLQAAPQLKCLVTTRRALGLHLERLIDVRPMPPPEAERLFVERACTRQSDFALTEDNAADVAELCRRLEGVPLGIELAASRIGTTTPREILERLDERFRVLQTRAPDLPPRQRALRGAIDWSYDLLTGEDQALFAQLSVFAGGFLLEDVEGVCDGPDVLEGLAELRRQSLLQSETEAATQRTRFLMLESLRAYAVEKLREAADGGESVRQRHAEHFLRFAELRVTKMRTREEARALDELSGAFDNLRAAMVWSQERAENELCARLALALYHLLYRRGFWEEAQRYLGAGWAATEWLEEQAETTVRSWRAAIGHYLASLAQDLGDLAEARRQAEASLALRRELQDRRGVAESLNLLGLLAIDEGNPEAAQQHLEEALRLLSERDHTRRGMVLHNLARLASRRDDAEEARRLYEEALRHRRADGDARGEADTLSNLGVLAYNAGNHTEARRLYLESLAPRRALRDRQGLAIGLYNLGELAEADHVETAIALYVHAERLFRELHSAYVTVPAEALQRLEEQLGSERFAELRQAAEGRTWEEVVEP